METPNTRARAFYRGTETPDDVTQVAGNRDLDPDMGLAEMEANFRRKWRRIEARSNRRSRANRGLAGNFARFGERVGQAKVS